MCYLYIICVRSFLSRLLRSKHFYLILGNYVQVFLYSLTLVISCPLPNITYHILNSDNLLHCSFPIAKFQ
jgi:hypothetical protein